MPAIGKLVIIKSVIVLDPYDAKEGDKNESETCERVGDAPNNNKNVWEEPEPSGENCKTVEVLETVA